ncbi:hypothetical protein V6N12_030859 [Hibiscus sabdariffa]|uniref:Non-haem dioxygenase N-terminal domain-containing protein n=1 Tax=Hibiscus sabdariffa TaxID=183260 RepID=A0ABR2E926_9ROSI
MLQQTHRTSPSSIPLVEGAERLWNAEHVTNHGMPSGDSCAAGVPVHDVGNLQSPVEVESGTDILPTMEHGVLGSSSMQPAAAYEETGNSDAGNLHTLLGDVGSPHGSPLMQSSRANSENIPDGFDTTLNSSVDRVCHNADLHDTPTELQDAPTSLGSSGTMSTVRGCEKSVEPAACSNVHPMEYFMSPAMAMAMANDDAKETDEFQKGVKHLLENGVRKLPDKYILPISDRPNVDKEQPIMAESSLKVPIIDFAELQGPNRSQVLNSLSSACEEYGFFQVVNHGVPIEVIRSMVDVSARFFGQPYEERSKYMSSDMASPVRYGTSWNQNKDAVFCWRDFLKLVCHPLSDSDVLPHWPSSPMDFRERAATYAKETKYLFLRIMEAILETLGLWVWGATKDDKTPENGDILKQLDDGSQLMQKSRHIPISPPRAVDFQRPIAPPFHPDQSRSNCLAAVLAGSGTCCCPCFSRSSLSSFAEIRAGRLTPVAGV